jgi:hypothetical protein
MDDRQVVADTLDAIDELDLICLGRGRTKWRYNQF